MNHGELDVAQHGGQRHVVVGGVEDVFEPGDRRMDQPHPCRREAKPARRGGHGLRLDPQGIRHLRWTLLHRLRLRGHLGMGSG